MVEPAISFRSSPRATPPRGDSEGVCHEQPTDHAHHTQHRHPLGSYLLYRGRFRSGGDAPATRMSALAWTSASRPFVRALSWTRLLARCISCYLQILKEHDELGRLSERSLQDIGLRPQDVETIMRRPTWSRCWQWVHSCRRNQCHASIVCKARCRPELSRPMG